MRHKIEITHYDEIVAREEFATFDEAENFWFWWANTPELPQGGAVIMRADKTNLWREQHPLTENLVDWRTIPGAPVGK